MLSRSSRVVAGALVLTLATAVPARAGSLSSSAQGTYATLTYRGPVTQASDLTLTITRHGTAGLHESVSSPMCGRLCWPAPVGPVLRVVNLGGTRPDVVVSLYSGGAHCCFIDQVFTESPEGTFVAKELTLGDPSARLERLSRGPLVFVTADDSFAYAFTDYAASGLPVKILAFRAQHFVDVTGDYPSVVARDAQRWWRAFTSTSSSHYADSVGLIAAWAADEDRLGRATMVARVLAAQARAGHLHSALNPVTSGGWHFVAQLNDLLTRLGYRL
ncbi:MAG TPA: hypothetical protein VLS91_03820 [Acidimicrobiales bacterium]|nr:hypothetical protein [Acidimicrobiales bacterium]